MAKDISYTNKDILMKHLARHFQGKSFQSLGVDLPKIKSFMPIELPTVLAKEFRLDNLFELEDSSLLLVDTRRTYIAPQIHWNLDLCGWKHGKFFSASLTVAPCTKTSAGKLKTMSRLRTRT
ncbi:MAG: hypothetical protein LBS84_01505 [Clostridiales bacterium]|nr:hypothetical protein [Clostridiales bacterium]